MSNRIEGKIAAILDKTTVVINRGADHGVTRGDTFYIYSQLGPFPDPDTGEDLGETTRIWGEVGVTIVEDRFCIARTQTTTNFHMPMLQSLFRTTRIQLPVEENDITRYVEKIGVGFSVISEEHQAAEIDESEVQALPGSTSDEEEESSDGQKQG